MPVADPSYEQERIRQALATDPRVGEPELTVDLVAGRVLVTGCVPSERVRAVNVLTDFVFFGCEVVSFFRF